MISAGLQHKIGIEQLIGNCLENSFPFALYRLPNEQITTLLISTNSEPIRKKIDFEECNAGFVFAPFSDGLPYFFNADLVFEAIDNFEFEVPESVSDLFQNKISLDNTFELTLSTRTEDKETYKSKVQTAIKEINEGNAQKIVLSRKKHIGTINKNNYFEGFKNLCSEYKSAFVSLISLPERNQIWMGASPEILVSQNQEGLFKTVALAGTQSAIDKDGNKIKPIDALWSHKEIEEQAIVGRYIINCLKKIRVREFDELGPKTVVAGNLLHLNTTYTIDSKEISFSNFSSVMLDLLHPTAAVCGMPKESSEAIIQQIEGYEREFYSGYLGPVNMHNSSQLFVNIRVMKIENGEVYAFAGGGLTEDSDPEKEWNETEIKLQTIQKSFSKIS